MAGVAAAAPSVASYAAADRRWRERLEVSCAVKLLGYVSIVLAYPDRAAVARPLLDCFWEVARWSSLIA